MSAKYAINITIVKHVGKITLISALPVTKIIVFHAILKEEHANFVIEIII